MASRAGAQGGCGPSTGSGAAVSALVRQGSHSKRRGVRGTGIELSAGREALSVHRDFLVTAVTCSRSRAPGSGPAVITFAL